MAAARWWLRQQLRPAGDRRRSGGLGNSSGSEAERSGCCGGEGASGGAHMLHEARIVSRAVTPAEREEQNQRRDAQDARG